MNKTMDIKKSVVTKIKYLEGNDYTGQYGTYFKFDVAFENGDVGEYAAKDKDNPKFKIGEEQEYKLDLTYPKFPKIKFHNAEYQNKFGGSKRTHNVETANDTTKSIIKQVCLKAAATLYSGTQDIDGLFHAWKSIHDKFYNKEDVDSKDGLPF